jgi:hypothetical protein
MRFLLGCWLLALHSLVQASDEAERAQIRQARDAVEMQHTQQQEACRKQFVVTPCLEKARADKNEKLKVLRAQEAELDDAVRRERAQAHALRMAEKAQAAQAREASKPPKPSKEPSAATPKAVKPAKPKASAPDRSAEEKRQREAFEARQREIQAHREEVEKRNVERAARKPPKPLPVPASAGIP